MINKYLKNLLKQNEIKTIQELINLLREEMQKMVLISLTRTDFFNKAAFYGGTCLRIFYGLDRFSEDLDFEVVSSNIRIELDEYIPVIREYLSSFGLSCVFSNPNRQITNSIQRIYIDFPICDLVNEYFENRLNVNKEMKISIKLEINTDYIEGATYENKLLVNPQFAYIKCFDIASLFSGKIHALIFRQWGNRVKGRDYYDYLFYIQNGAKYNSTYLDNKIKQTNNELNINIKTELKKKFSIVSIEQILNDLKPFVSPNDPLVKNIQNDILISTLDCF